MKRKLAILLPACFLLLAAVRALAAGGTEDPLISLSYLEGIFTNRLDAAIDQRLDSTGDALQNTAGTGAARSAAVWTETRLKESDILSCSTGSSVLLLAGAARVSYTGGAVVDVTEGIEIPSGAALTANHRYIAAEDTAAAVTVTSKTAVVDYQGDTSVACSDAVDYNAMAAALKTLHLFRGSSIGYGQGFALEAAPTRLQALIMFIRVLGEEEQALAWTGTMPFQDVSAGSDAEKYVGYAYEKGYTNGYGSREFRPSLAVNANQYTEFLLRATGYSSAANSNISDALDRARQAGVLTAGEAAMLQAGPFLRAELVYISYYALDASLSGGGWTLAERLLQQGIFTTAEWAAARRAVPGERL